MKVDWVIFNCLTLSIFFKKNNFKYTKKSNDAKTYHIVKINN